MLVKVINVPLSSSVDEVCIAKLATVASLRSDTGHWGNYEGLTHFRMFEETRSKIDQLTESAKAQESRLIYQKRRLAFQEVELAELSKNVRILTMESEVSCPSKNDIFVHLEGTL